MLEVVLPYYQPGVEVQRLGYAQRYRENIISALCVVDPNRALLNNDLKLGSRFLNAISKSLLGHEEELGKMTKHNVKDDLFDFSEPGFKMFTEYILRILQKFYENTPIITPLYGLLHHKEFLQTFFKLFYSPDPEERLAVENLMVSQLKRLASSDHVSQQESVMMIGQMMQAQLEDVGRSSKSSTMRPAGNLIRMTDT